MSVEEAATAQADAADAAPSAQGEAIPQRADGAAEQAEASGKRSKRTYSRHGLTALRQRVKLRGLNAIDRRTAAAQELLRFRAELLSDLGGEDHASAAQKKLVELACRTALFLNHIDGWLAAQPTLVRKRAMLPALRERQQLADSLARYLSLLGLERRAKPVPALADYLKARHEGSEAATGPSRPSDDKDPYSGRRKRSPGRIARQRAEDTSVQTERQPTGRTPSDDSKGYSASETGSEGRLERQQPAAQEADQVALADQVAQVARSDQVALLECAELGAQEAAERVDEPTSSPDYSHEAKKGSTVNVERRGTVAPEPARGPKALRSEAGPGHNFTDSTGPADGPAGRVAREEGQQ